jgi:hypothetical protein
VVGDIIVEPTMKHLGVIGFAVAIAALAGAGVVSAQPSEIKAAAEPIMKQLEAFRRDDYDAAYVFASTEIKQMFDRQAFERMVKGGYPEIAQSTFAVVSRTSRAQAGTCTSTSGSRARTVAASRRSTRWCRSAMAGRSMAR